MNPFAGVSLHTLGRFALAYREQPCELAYEKGRALLIFLAMEPGRTYSRASLASMLWPELEREAALTNLRQILLNLRQAFSRLGLNESPLHVDRESIRVHAGFGLCVDAVELAAFSHACPESPFFSHCRLCIEQMERVTDPYAGEFMQGFSLPDCPDFEEWLQVQREALHLRVLGILARLSDCHELMGAPARALPVALRFLELEPWSEEGLRRVMRLYAQNGQPERALERYTTCCSALKRELGVLPSEATRMLAGSIERGELVGGSRDREVGSDNPKMAANTPLAIAERRQVTVLFCELTPVGVDDPDEALAALDAPQLHCINMIRHHCGFLVQTHGGGLLAYFGYPLAAENAARQAIQTALGLVRAYFPAVEVRVGIHSGMVITSDHLIPDAIGATSGLAIRLRQVAEPGEIAISAATQRLVAGFFESVSLGLRQLRGIARPLEVFRVDGESGAKDRLEAAGALTPLVGRHEEIDCLLSFWQASCHGQGKVVLLRGEPGVGKSRLILTLKEILREQACVVRELRCFPEHSHTPFRPLVELLESVCEFQPDDTPGEKFEKLAVYVEAHYTGLSEHAVPLFARMMALGLRKPYRESDLTLQQQRERVLEILIERQYALTQGENYLLIVEDLHWADPSTLELLRLFVTRERRGPVLALLTARHGFQPPWTENLTERIDLQALDADEMVSLITSLAPRITESMVARIVERADGIPLFAEELAREMVCGEPNDIPPTLLDLLLSRLDGLGVAKLVAQAAATVGREFDLGVLSHITPFDDLTLKQHVGALLEVGLLLSGEKGMFRFKHALIRDAAYQSQARNERETMHRRIASALDAQGSEVRPELRAQHWEAAGESRMAIDCWIAAGKMASQESACQEAMAHFRAGLALSENLPVETERERLELELYIGLGTASAAVHGYAFAEGVEFYERAMALCGLRADDPSIFTAIWRLWASASSRAGYSCASDLAQYLVRMAEAGGDPVQQQQAHFALANTLYWQGDFGTARTHLEHLRAMYRPGKHASHVAGFGEDAGVTGESYYSWVMWFLGFPDQAGKASRQAVKLARRLGHPFSLAYALTFASILHCRLGDEKAAQALALETQELSRRHGYALWEIGASLALGWAQARQGCSAGVETIRQCAEATRVAMGGVTLVTLGPLADALVALGMFDEAHSVCEESFLAGSRIGDRHIMAELHRLKGEALLGMSTANERAAEDCFQTALSLSRRQQARSIELRSATSMARLWQRQGRVPEAKTLLEDVYHDFVEGFETSDLRSARKLLDGLNS